MAELNVRKALAALYRVSWSERIHTAVKFYIVPFEEFSRHLPTTGTILDVGCGYGYVANYLSLESSGRQVVGNDIATDRLQVAQRTVGNRRNITFVLSDSRNLKLGGLDGVILADVLHHIPYADQEQILADLFDKLKPGGVLVMRETDKKPRLRYFLCNYLLEWLCYPHGVKLLFRKADEWAGMLRSVGYEIKRVIPNPPCFLYLTVTFVCVKHNGT
jgi:2-polyprenyl-3-methyl-5-hydroxy-6-metoxy-1,4-benzoquinol methylase